MNKSNVFKGYFNVVSLWKNKNGYELPYIYFVVSILYQRFQKDGLKQKMGYVIGALKRMEDRYDPEVHKLPSGGDREELLAAGHTIKTLPYHLLTREEREMIKNPGRKKLSKLVDMIRDANTGKSEEELNQSLGDFLNGK